MDAATIGANLQNLMGMAGTAERAKNNDEAISYYNRVLEADPTFSEAWLGKGRAAGWLSTLANVRVNETIVAFGHAIATADEASKATVASRARDDLLTIVNALYGMADRHHRDHAEVPSARTTYVQVTAGLLDALATARSWGAEDRATLDSVVTMARGLLNLGVNPELTAVLKSQMAEANAAISTIDPNYQPPNLATQTVVQKEAAKADFDNLGYVVLFIVIILAAVIGAASR